ncbi:site-2 protease family protein [Hyphobacterium sp. CCMP332]|nr:site-2 protease family protein [Hyphobacterium sp. CCMP332]
MEEFSPKTIAIHVGLFIISFITATIAGMEWVNGSLLLLSDSEREINWWSKENIYQGLRYSVVFLGVLSFHEFGHYFTARYHNIRTTLPYYIPLWLGFGLSFGSMGALIRIKQTILSRKKYFDVGIAGPLAGFVVALVVLVYGFTHLPELEYLFKYNPEYAKYGRDYAQYVYKDMDFGVFRVGKNLMFIILENLLVDDPSKIPNGYEMIHYPIIFAGYLTLFFTALNLLPIGQLDGGHITFGLFGTKNSRIISAILFIIFVFYAGLGWTTPFLPTQELLITIPLQLGLYYFIFAKVSPKRMDVILLAVGTFSIQFLLSFLIPGIEGYQGWLFFAFILGRFLGVYHPGALDQRPLSPARKLLGWICLIIFILCFTPKPFVFEIPVY